jgi:hypothetical protein
MTEVMRSFRDRIKINKTDKVIAQPLIGTPIEIGPEEIENSLSARLENTDKFGLETNPRKTVLKLVETPLDTKFIFRVTRGEAENFISAMRQVLSRVRKKAKKNKWRLDEFKMLTIECKQFEEYDEICLVRTKTLDPYEESVYESLFAALKKD